MAAMAQVLMNKMDEIIGISAFLPKFYNGSNKIGDFMSNDENKMYYCSRKYSGSLISMTVVMAEGRLHLIYKSKNSQDNEFTKLGRIIFTLYFLAITRAKNEKNDDETIEKYENRIEEQLDVEMYKLMLFMYVFKMTIHFELMENLLHHHAQIYDKCVPIITAMTYIKENVNNVVPFNEMVNICNDFGLPFPEFTILRTREQYNNFKMRVDMDEINERELVTSIINHKYIDSKKMKPIREGWVVKFCSVKNDELLIKDITKKQKEERVKIIRELDIIMEKFNKIVQEPEIENILNSEKTVKNTGKLYNFLDGLLNEFIKNYEYPIKFVHCYKCDRKEECEDLTEEIKSKILNLPNIQMENLVELNVCHTYINISNTRLNSFVLEASSEIFRKYPNLPRGLSIICGSECDDKVSNFNKKRLSMIYQISNMPSIVDFINDQEKETYYDVECIIKMKTTEYYIYTNVIRTILDETLKEDCKEVNIEKLREMIMKFVSNNGRRILKIQENEWINNYVVIHVEKFVNYSMGRLNKNELNNRQKLVSKYLNLYDKFLKNGNERKIPYHQLMMFNEWLESRIQIEEYRRRQQMILCRPK